MKFKFIIFTLLITFPMIAGCATDNAQFVPLDDYSILGKRKDAEKINVTDFIRPEETGELISKMPLDNKDEKEKINIIFKYVCELKNINEETDYWQYPSETILKGGGDCEDKVFLLSSALMKAGINNVYAVKGRYLGGGHFWVECNDTILDPSRNKGRGVPKNKALGYTAFFKFDNKQIYISEKLGEYNEK